MSFLVPCPHCGPRGVDEFRWGGEQSRRPEPGAPPETWTEYLYARANTAGEQQEWWFHRTGCRRWFLAVRDTRTNRVARTFWPGADTRSGDRAPALPAPANPGGGSEGAVEASSER